MRLQPDGVESLIERTCRLWIDSYHSPQSIERHVLFLTSEGCVNWKGKFFRAPRTRYAQRTPRFAGEKLDRSSATRKTPIFRGRATGASSGPERTADLPIVRRCPRVRLAVYSPLLSLFDQPDDPCPDRVGKS